VWKSIKKGFKFCVKCGNQVSSSQDSSKTKNYTVPSVKPPTRNAFMLKKKNDRIGHFKPKKVKSPKVDDELISMPVHNRLSILFSA